MTSRGGFYAWRETVKKRESTNRNVLFHPLVSEAFGRGYYLGQRERIGLESDFAGAVETLRRLADLLEQLSYEREAMQLVAEDAR